MWDQPDCIEYLKTAAVLAAYVDQSISTNTFYSPKYFENGKIPATLIAKNLMMAHYWGIKTLYYNITNKIGIKSDQIETTHPLPVADYEDDDSDCLACKL